MLIQQKAKFDCTRSNLDSFLDEEHNLNEVDAEEGIRQGLEDSRLGRVRPIREFFAEFEAGHGISHD